jgi:hypothetical protein
MSNSNNLYNILAAFNKVANSAEPASTKQQAQAIYESVEAKGSITGGVRGAEKKLSDAFAKHKVDEARDHAADETARIETNKFTAAQQRMRKEKADAKKKADDKKKVAEAKKAKKDWDKDGKIESEKDEVIGSRRRAAGLDEGKMSEMDADLKDSSFSDADFKKKYGKSKAEMRKSMSEAAGDDLQWYDQPDSGDTTVDTPTGRIHRAGRGGYGNKVDDDMPMALPAGQVARGRGRPKNLAGELKRKAAAERLAANGGVKQGRGRPRKNPVAGEPNSAPQGTLGLHRFLFGPMPDKLPGKPGLKHKIADEGMMESARPSNLKGYIAEAAGQDAFEHILHRYKHEVKTFGLAGGDMDQDLYDALFDYYLNAGEMPYGIAKSRTGDPYEWVSHRFAQDMKQAGTPEVDEAVDPLTIPAYKRKAAGQAPLSMDQVRAPRADSISDKRNLAQANGSKELDDLARLAGITTESVSVIGGDVESSMDSGADSRMNISTNQSSDGTKNVTVTADGEAAVALLQMLKMAGMGDSDAAREQEVIIASPGDEHMGDEECEMEMEEEYANEPAPVYQSVEKITSAGDDMNREKKQNFPIRAPGNNPMSEMSIDPGKSMGRDLMAEYQAMKLRK